MATFTARAPGIVIPAKAGIPLYCLNHSFTSYCGLIVNCQAGISSGSHPLSAVGAARASKSDRMIVLRIGAPCDPYLNVTPKRNEM